MLWLCRTADSLDRCRHWLKGITGLLRLDMPQQLYANNSCRELFAIGASGRILFWS